MKVILKMAVQEDKAMQDLESESFLIGADQKVKAAPAIFRIYKLPLTMLELLIALSLSIIILTSLTYFYQQITLTGVFLERAQKENFQIRYLENRLGKVLNSTISAKDPANYFHFFTSPDTGGLYLPGTQSLLFTFDNNVQSNKAMSALVVGRLFVDRNGRLILATWPTEKRWLEGQPPPVAHEVLLEGVDALAFRFFVPPKKGGTKEEAAATPAPLTFPQDEQGGWLNDWPKEYRELPAIVQIILKQGERSLIFAYPLPHTKQPITYDL